MTEQELKIEWQYRFEERLGILCEDKEPTNEEYKIAKDEADEAIIKLRNEPI